MGAVGAWPARLRSRAPIYARWEPSSSLASRLLGMLGDAGAVTGRPPIPAAGSAAGGSRSQCRPNRQLIELIETPDSA